MLNRFYVAMLSLTYSVFEGVALSQQRTNILDM
jgi:hypothetical protein